MLWLKLGNSCVANISTASEFHVLNLRMPGDSELAWYLYAFYNDDFPDGQFALPIFRGSRAM
jgi:hypothetical protein